MARTLNGTSDEIRADGANVFAANTAFSVAVWLNASGSITNEVYYGEGLNGNNPHFMLQCNSGKLRIFLRSNAGTSLINGISSALTIADSTWHHVVYAQNGSGGWQAYIDGAADGTAKGTYSAGATNACTFLGLGALPRSTVTNFWAGTLSYVANWTRQLGAKEVLGLANGVSPLAYAPTHYWPLWGVDSPEPDIGNG